MLVILVVDNVFLAIFDEFKLTGVTNAAGGSNVVGAMWAGCFIVDIVPILSRYQMRAGVICSFAGAGEDLHAVVAVLSKPGTHANEAARYEEVRGGYGEQSEQAGQYKVHLPQKSLDGEQFGT